MSGDEHVRSLAPSIEAYEQVVRLKARLSECPSDVQDVAASLLLECADLPPDDVICWVFNASGEVVTEMARRGMDLVFANRLEPIIGANKALLEGGFA